MSSTSTRLLAPEGPCSGHWVAEQVPEEMLAALREVLAPYRDGGGDLR
jgi:hypothetical protein